MSWIIQRSEYNWHSCTLRYVTVLSKNTDAIQFLWIKFDDYMIKIMNDSRGGIKITFKTIIFYLFGKEGKIES